MSACRAGLAARPPMNAILALTHLIDSGTALSLPPALAALFKVGRGQWLSEARSRVTVCCSSLSSSSDQSFGLMVSKRKRVLFNAAIVFYRPLSALYCTRTLLGRYPLYLGLQSFEGIQEALSRKGRLIQRV